VPSGVETASSQMVVYSDAPIVVHALSPSHAGWVMHLKSRSCFLEIQIVASRHSLRMSLPPACHLLGTLEFPAETILHSQAHLPRT
jgi:hypothetical protein